MYQASICAQRYLNVFTFEYVRLRGVRNVVYLCKPVGT